MATVVISLHAHASSEKTFFCIYFIAASYRVKAPSSKEGDYHLEDVKEVKLQSNPAYEAVNTT